MSQPSYTTIWSMPDAEFDHLYENYRKCLSRLRHLTEDVRKLPEVVFFIFGMGSRQKLIYRDGNLREALTGRILFSWNVKHQKILPSEYCVKLWTSQGGTVTIWEDEQGIWLAERGSTIRIDQGEVVSLPRFQGHSYASVLRVLHHELLVNIIDGKPVPNFWVYETPWYRDSAVMALALRITGNDGLLKKWILSLREVYDRNNAGEEEADNLGQALFLISLAGDATHPLIPSILSEISKWQQQDWICGRSDFSEHAVYQTKWLKFGLKSLGLEDSFQIPSIADSYSSLFWLDFHDTHVECPRFRGLDYPYLNWAEGHFYKQYRGPMSSRDYPLSWEANASQANYAGFAPVLPEYIPEKLAAPHTWHAAEMFLSLWEAET